MSVALQRWPIIVHPTTTFTGVASPRRSVRHHGCHPVGQHNQRCQGNHHLFRFHQLHHCHLVAHCRLPAPPELAADCAWSQWRASAHLTTIKLLRYLTATQSRLVRYVRRMESVARAAFSTIAASTTTCTVGSAAVRLPSRRHGIRSIRCPGRCVPQWPAWLLSAWCFASSTVADVEPHPELRAA